MRSRFDLGQRGFWKAIGLRLKDDPRCFVRGFQKLASRDAVISDFQERAWRRSAGRRVETGMSFERDLHARIDGEVIVGKIVEAESRRQCRH